MKNKKGWIKIVEAFVAVLFIAGILLIIISSKHLVISDPDSDIYDSQLIILRDIQMNNTLRQFILDAIPPVESDDVGFPQDVKDRIDYLTPSYLECLAKICEIELDCNLGTLLERNIYVQTVMITVTETQEGVMDPRQLKLFCWVK